MAGCDRLNLHTLADAVQDGVHSHLHWRWLLIPGLQSRKRLDQNAAPKRSDPLPLTQNLTPQATLLVNSPCDLCYYSSDVGKIPRFLCTIDDHDLRIYRPHCPGLLPEHNIAAGARGMYTGEGVCVRDVRGGCIRDVRGECIRDVRGGCIRDVRV
jgi:hypothetical protein